MPKHVGTDTYHEFYIMCGNKMKVDATEVFIADLTVRSTCFGRHYAHNQELKSIIQWLLPVVPQAANTV
jgi:hypothetical protein